MNLRQRIKNKVLHEPFVIHRINDHTMGPSILQYLDIKIHHFIKEANYKKVIVLGEYDRHAEISKYEKKGKKANWQRPTAVVEDSVLYIKCFPGIDYVRHYASLIATFLTLNDYPVKDVKYILPSEEECCNALDIKKIKKIPRGHTLVTGYALPEISGIDEEQWDDDGQYRWVSKQVGNKSVTYLAVQYSYWSDILRRLITALGELEFNSMIYTAKVGGMNREHIPNFHLATGDKSLVEGEVVEWQNIFANIKHPELLSGFHINSPSVLFENKQWLGKMDRFDFVDSEVGQFAKGASGLGVNFGYLHYIANNLTNPHPEDLSNERDVNVLNKRHRIKGKIAELINDVIAIKK